MWGKRRGWRCCWKCVSDERVCCRCNLCRCVSETKSVGSGGFGSQQESFCGAYMNNTGLASAFRWRHLDGMMALAKGAA